MPSRRSADRLRCFAISADTRTGVAISNHRLLEFDGERVTFRWKDYAHGNKQRKMTLPPSEFLRRFVQHVLPRGFVRIRQYGFLANRRRASGILLARQFLASGPMPREPCADKAGAPASWQCPRCGTTMQIGPNLTPGQLASRCKYFDSS
jgi:Putative transposase